MLIFRRQLAGNIIQQAGAGQGRFVFGLLGLVLDAAHVVSLDEDRRDRGRFFLLGLFKVGQIGLDPLQQRLLLLLFAFQIGFIFLPGAHGLFFPSQGVFDIFLRLGHLFPGLPDLNAQLLVLGLGADFIHLPFPEPDGLGLGLLLDQFGLQLDLVDLYHGLLNLFRLLLQLAALGLEPGLFFGVALIMLRLVLADNLLGLFFGREPRGLDCGLFFLQRLKFLGIAGILLGQFSAFLFQPGPGLFPQVLFMPFILPALLLGLLFK